MKKHEHIVKSLMPGGIGEELGIEPGDKLLAINGNEIQDVFDYYYYEESEQLLLLIEKPDGEEWELEIEKDEDESLGIEFDQSLWMSTVPAEINVCSVSLTRCQRECGRHYILKTMIPVCHFCRAIILR